MSKDRRDIVIGTDKETGKDYTLGEFQDFIKETAERLFKRPVKVGSLIIKEDFDEEDLEAQRTDAAERENHRKDVEGEEIL